MYDKDHVYIYKYVDPPLLRSEMVSGCKVWKKNGWTECQTKHVESCPDPRIKFIDGQSTFGLARARWQTSPFRRSQNYFGCMGGGIPKHDSCFVKMFTLILGHFYTCMEILPQAPKPIGLCTFQCQEIAPLFVNYLFSSLSIGQPSRSSSSAMSLISSCSSPQLSPKLSKWEPLSWPGSSLTAAPLSFLFLLFPFAFGFALASALRLTFRSTYLRPWTCLYNAHGSKLWVTRSTAKKKVGIAVLSFLRRSCACTL